MNTSLVNTSSHNTQSVAICSKAMKKKVKGGHIISLRFQAQADVSQSHLET